MSDEIDWGPWVDHDGKGCPVPVGVLVHRVFEFAVPSGIARGLDEHIAPRDERETNSWNGRSDIAVQVVKFRTPKSEALKQLHSLLEHLPTDKELSGV